MQQMTLLYHDVIEGDRHEVSGFPDPAARRYKLDRADFVRHLDAIEAATSRAPIAVHAIESEPTSPCPVTIGFDDGGVSALTIIAPEFEQRGWPAHFFITTDYIGTPGFLTEDQIRELHSRGHVIGSHSCSHPNPMAGCSSEQLADEWSRSIARLSEIVGEQVTVGSIPGGAYSKEVARQAAAAGITWLFTSEPTRRPWQVNGCTLLGRFGIEMEDSPEKAAAFASGQFSTRAKEWAVWNTKKTIKRLAGPLFYKIRAWQHRNQ